MKRFLELIILLPIAIIGIALAVANRHAVTVSFDPFSSNPAGAIEAPLFIVLIAAIIVGVIVGGLFTWFSQGKHRRALRESRAETARLRAQITQS